MDECGGVIIRFPSEGSTSDKVTIRGPKDDVESAKKQLQELTSEKVKLCPLGSHLFIVNRRKVSSCKVVFAYILLCKFNYVAISANVKLH